MFKRGPLLIGDMADVMQSYGEWTKKLGCDTPQIMYMTK